MLMSAPGLLFKLFSQTIKVKMMELPYPVGHIYL